MANWSGQQPAYKQVAAELRERIRDGRLDVGAQLPSIASLMDEFSVSITVVRMALSELRSEGLIASHQGKGAFVLSAPSAEAADNNGDLRAELRRQDAELRKLSERVAALETRRPRKASR
jgi:DNA-binding GntR family transcriptional regulator